MSNRNKWYNPYTLTKHRIFHIEKLNRFLRNRYSYIFESEEKKKELEAAIPFRYLEKIVALEGRAAVYKRENYGFGVYKMVMAGDLDFHGNPGTYHLRNANGSVNLKVKADDENLVILQDHFDGSSLQSLVYYYGEQMGKVRETISTNVHGMRHPFLLRAPKKLVETIELALEAMQESTKVVLDDGVMGEFGDSLSVVDLKTPDNLKSLEDEFNVLFSNFKGDIGFTSNNVDKKERLVAAEADFDNEPYENRRHFIEQMDKKFSIKLTLVKANDQLYMESKEKTDKKVVNVNAS